MASTGASQMIVFGGKGTNGDLADMWILKINSWTDKVVWEEVKPAGKLQPTARHGHCSIFVPQIGSLLIQGSLPYMAFFGCIAFFFLFFVFFFLKRFFEPFGLCSRWIQQVVRYGL
jgi:hypothetical protein